jgi:hypothetical protein
MGKTRVVVQVAMVLLDDPTAGEADHAAADHPLSLRIQRLRRLPGIGTISLIHVLAEVGCFLGRFDSAERAAAGYQRSTTISVPPISVCR